MIVEDSNTSEPAVTPLQGKPLGDLPSHTLKTYGTISCGLETMKGAWASLTHVFSYGGCPVTSDGLFATPGRPPRNALSERPVHLLIIDQGSSRPSQQLPTHWSQMVQECPLPLRPRVILESWPEQAVSWTVSPTDKAQRTRWRDLGYASRFRLIRTTNHGGALDQTRLIVARLSPELDATWAWTRPARGSPRAMANLLTPHGLLPRQVKRHTHRPGTQDYPNADVDPMPNCLGAYIHTQQGVRRLQADELARGLGCAKATLAAFPSPSNKGLLHTTSAFIWEALSEPLQGCATTPPVPVNVFHDWDFLTQSALDPARGRVPAAPPPQPSSGFRWSCPDLSPEGDWYKHRLDSLRRACKVYARQGKDSDGLYKEGLTILERHRHNYLGDGPSVQHLQLIWWEFPPEHWDAIRDGSRMGFLTTPPSTLHDNAPMDETQLKVAAQFVDELIDIGAVGPPPGDGRVHANTPLFCLEKPGQPGEWRVIADCKAGGQNAHMGPDPVYLNRPLHILEQMYHGGWTAVADASKFFYQFPSHPDDQPWLGLIHPLTGKHHVWCGCPMGSGSSPALAGRYGLAFVRLLRERSEWFHTTPTANCWWSELREEGYDPKRGYGFSLSRTDGKPSVRIWVFVDDFCIHGPDKASTEAALAAFLDLAVDVGLLVHPKKLKPPAQVQEYTGFLFDTTGPPTLKIPPAKTERALAMADHLRGYPTGKPLSRLALSVIAGTLESLADATPRRLGHTYLRHTHGLIHPSGMDPGPDVYYTSCVVTPPVRREMAWWIRLLQNPIGRVVNSAASSTLIPTWGDGSGTGTGGTISLPNQPLHLWMGQWTPVVHHCSSNWKELKTLLLTLQQLATAPTDDLEGSTVFYFTDNSVTYYVSSSGASSSPGLHSLVEQIQLLTLDLGFHLEVVHVPGLAMIQQGTDGLSRGIWMSHLHPSVDQHALTRAVFEPMRPAPEEIRRVVHEHALPGEPRLVPWDHPGGADLFHTFTVWFPPPELARQCLIRVIESWVEVPRTTSALFFIPRTLSHCWTGLSRHLRLLETIYPHKQYLATPPLLPIPILVLYLPAHVPSLPPPDRLEPSPRPRGYRAHAAMAEAVRRLPPTDPAWPTGSLLSLC